MSMSTITEEQELKELNDLYAGLDEMIVAECDHCGFRDNDLVNGTCLDCRKSDAHDLAVIAYWKDPDGAAPEQLGGAYPHLTDRN